LAKKLFINFLSFVSGFQKCIYYYLSAVKFNIKNCMWTCINKQELLLFFRFISDKLNSIMVIINNCYNGYIFGSKLQLFDNLFEIFSIN
jgi:hypothetical protein